MAHSRFVIRNDWSDLLFLSIEPEGTTHPLGRGEEVEVFDEFTDSPVTLKLSNFNGGEPVLSIWPGDGVVRVEKGGVDLLDSIVRERVQA